MRTLKLLVLAAASAAAAGALALDSPHDGSFSSGVTECLSCHKLHGTTGGTLLGNDYTSNNDACLSCHDGASSPNHVFTPAWSAAPQANPDTGVGSHHNWSGAPTARGARVPSNAAMASYLTGTRTLQCAVCHDVHGAKDPATGLPANRDYAPNSARASLKLGVAYGPEGGGTGRMKLVSITDGGWPPTPAGYAVRVVAGNKVEISHDYAKSATPIWNLIDFPFTVGDTAANDYALDDLSVLVRFTVAPLVGETWVFHVSYPLLRASNVGDAMCMDCHLDRVQDHTCVNGTSCNANGTLQFSHPVNQALNANGEGYDRAAPIDVDGTSQDQAVEANPSNRLTLDGGLVRCTTCHAPHNADSNSVTVDAR